MIDYDDMFNSVGLEKDYFNATDGEIKGPILTWKDLCVQFNYTNIECDDVNDATYDEDECLEIANGKVPWPGPQCSSTQKPLDFVYVKQTNNYRLDPYESDAHLLYKVRTGKGDPNIYGAYKSIIPSLFFAGSFPETIESDYKSGENDVLTARASRFITFADGDRHPELNSTWSTEWEQRLED